MLTHHRRLGALLILPVVIGVALFLGEMIWASYRTHFAWPLTTGAVTSSETLTGRGKYGKTTYGVGLTVSYAENGHTFVARAQTYVWTTDYREHQENLQRYPPGTKVQIRYNPDEPSQVRLSPDLIESLPPLPVIGILLVGSVLGVLFVRWSRPKRSE